MNKWVGVGLGALLGVTNLGMIVLVVNSRTTKLPKLNLPVGPYTSYMVEASKKGTRLNINRMILKSCIPLKILKQKVVS